MLLATKFLKPAPDPRAVERSRLLGRFQAGHGHHLTTVLAPAGYGKTTLVNQWCESVNSNFGVAWLSLDPHDDEPRRFWQYIIGALGQTLLDPAALERRLGELNDETLDAVVTAILNELTLLHSPANCLVLDDYHLITNPVIHRQLAYLVDYLSPNFSLVLISRTEPPLPLARWRVRGWLAEIHASDLAFSEDECALFFTDYMALSLSPEAISQLWRRTEGWAAAMQLAALAGSESAASGQEEIIRYGGHHKHVSDYVLTEILEQQPANVREFLLNTACCLRLNPSLCDALLETNDSERRLEALVKANLFIIPLDAGGHWYRYHDLFREALSARLRKIDPERHTQLQERAIRWFLKQDQFQEAIPHLIELEDWDWLAQVLEQHGNNLIHEGYHLVVLRWLDCLPPAHADERPRLLMLRVWGLFFSNKLDHIEPLLERLEDLLDHQVAVSHPDADKALDLHSEVALVRSYLARMRSDLESASDLTKGVLKDIDHTNIPLKSVTYYGIGLDSYARGDLHDARQALDLAIDHGKREKRHSTVLSSGGLMAWILFHQGEMDLALEICSGVRHWVDSFHTDPSQPRLISCWQNSSMAQIYREKNDLGLAQTYLNPLLEHVTQGTEPGQHIVIQYVRAHLSFSQGDFEAAISILEDAENVLAHKRDTILFEPPCLEALRTRCLLGMGELDRAKSWADGVDEGQYRNPINREQTLITEARVRVATGDPQHAIEVLKPLRLVTEQGQHIKHLIELLSVYSTALAALGQMQDATALLERALILASRDDFIRLFHEEGPALSAVYASLDRGNLRQSLADQLDDLLLAPLKNRRQTPEESRKSAGSDKGKFAEELVEPLSQRELEVLELIHDGLPNKLIAQRLDVAPTTVKAHIRNLYGKLGTRSRTEALARARNLGLLQ